MTTQVITVDKALVKDELNWPVKDAFIAIWDIDEVITTSSTSKDGISDYVESSKSHVIEYRGNYWGSKQMQVDGLESRPLAHYVHFDAEALYEKNADGEHALDDSGNKKTTGEVVPAYKVWDDTFTVDMGHLQSVNVVNSSMSGREERNRLIQLDVERRFPK